MKSVLTSIFEYLSKFNLRSLKMIEPSKRNFAIALIFIILTSLAGCGLNKKDWNMNTLFEKVKDQFKNNSIVGLQEDNTRIVATSQLIDPAGETIHFAGRPVDLALNNSGSLLAVKNNTSIVFMNAEMHKVIQTLKLPSGGHSFTGITWSLDDQKVWTTDTKGYLRAARSANGSFIWDDAILLPGLDANDKSGSYPGGLAIDNEKGIAYVALSRNNTLGIVNLKTKQLESQIKVGISPYTVLIQNNYAYVSNWGGRQPLSGDKVGPSGGSSVVIDPKTGIASTGTVSVIDLTSQKVIKEIDVHLHPSDMISSPDKTHIYVANANSDLISVIDTRTNTLTKDLSSKPMSELPFGSAPNSLTISRDGKTLFVANGGNNHLAVIDLISGKVKGLIPTGWYPGSVVISADGTKLFVANTKGDGRPQAGLRDKGINSHDHSGSVSFITVPNSENLRDYTIRAATSMRLPKITQALKLKRVNERIVPVPTRPGEKSVFKHVLYIIKENRTYDQVFGDLPQGKGDSSLTQFGRKVTPNHHALAENFVLLDNTYCNGVLSADGHQWANEGYVTDYIEKSFGGFVRSYPYEGDDALAFASSGFIWDKVLDAGLTFRNYGEFVTAKIEPANASWTQLYTDYKNGTRNVKIKATSKLHTLEPYLCPTFVGFPSSIPDVYRAGEFLKEFREYEKTNSLPNFMIMLLPNDHTTGTKENFPTPRAQVADNDLALGQIVEAVSKSKFWKETAIFVIEDDPQAGLDHVDGRRTVALCISPYTKRGEVISTHYNQNSILRTIELILGLSPMSQFDMIANPMTDCFTSKPDFSPYTALANQIPLDEMNPKLSTLSGKKKFWAKKSMEMELSELDQANEDTLNLILWYSVKGYNTPYPKIARK
jgi:YVTN family beta-propeller protein